jgi:hypothetical protein
VNDAVVVRGAGAQYTHVFGSNLFNGSNGTVSGAGVTAPFAAWNGADTLIALNITADASAALGARTLTVNNGVGASAGVTLTVVAGAPTITSIVGWAEAAPQGFLGIRRVVYINGTNFDAPGAVTVNVSGGITVSNVIVNSATQVQADFTGTAVGNWNVSVTTTSGTSGTGVFSVIPVTSLPTAGMVVNQILSTRHTNHPGTLGMHFTVGAKDRLVTHLGRWKFSDSVQQHEMALLNDQWQIIARVVVDLGPGAVDTWVYAPLPAPVVLKANTGYMLTDLYHCGGPDSWANVSSLAPDGNVTIDGYLVTASVQYKETFSALRSDSYSIGIKFVAGGAYGVVALGRYKNPGNNLSHRILLKDAAGQIVRTATVDFSGGKGVDSHVNYGSVPLFTLTTGNTYYLLSDEQGGDTWHQYPCSITPWGGLTNLGYAYEAYPGQNGLIPPTVAGDAANLFGGTDILCIASQWYNRSESHGTFNLKWLSAGQPVAMII